MIDRLKKSIQQATESLRDQALNLGESAREKGYMLIDQWIQILPDIEAYGFEITSFGIGVALSPSLEVEFKGDSSEFSPQRIEHILSEVKDSTPLSMVFKTLKTTLELRKKINDRDFSDIFLILSIRISPEVKVLCGKPEIH